MFDEYTYQVIGDEICEIVGKLNIRRGLIDILIKRKEYQKEIPNLEYFNNHQKPIRIYSKTKINDSEKIIAKLRPGSFKNRLEGTLYESKDKNATEEIRKTIHALSHKYSVKVSGELI